MSDQQALDIYNQRMALFTRITNHRHHAPHFVDILPNEGDLPDSLSEETDGQPEQARLHIPSQLGSRISRTERSERAIDLEVTLRRVECFETLRRVRTALSQKATILEGKRKNARGEIANTRAQTMINRVSLRITQTKDDYNRSYEALRRLGLTASRLRPLIRLQSQHFSGITSILLGQRDLHEGRKRLPWFWGVRDAEAEDETAEEQADVEEFNEGRSPVI
jgi:hypothetical protein